MWPKDKCREALHLWVEKHGRVPTAHKDWRAAGYGHPSSHTIFRTFPSWNEFLRECGYEPHRPGYAPIWTKDRIADAMLDYRVVHGRWPNSTDWHHADPEGKRPSIWTVRRVFGGWIKAEVYAGRTLTPARRSRMTVNDHLKKKVPIKC